MEFRRMLKKFTPKAFLSFFDSKNGKKNKNQIPYISKEEINAKIDFLKTKYRNDAEISYSVDGLIRAIKANDALMLKYIFDGLVQKNIQLDEESKEALIFIAAGFGRVAILETLQAYVPSPHIDSNKLAKSLLEHPYREMIGNLCAQHLDGLGRLHELNFETDLSILLAYVKQLNQSATKEFDTAVILNELDVGGFTNYLEAIKEAHRVSNAPSLASSFIIGKNYLSSGEIIIEKSGAVTVLCFDLQDTLALQKKNFTNYFDAIRSVFPNAQFFVSESKLPFPGHCDIFTLLGALQALHNNALDVIAYAKENVRQVVATGSEGNVYQYQIFQTPLQLSNEPLVESMDFKPTLVTRGGFMGVASSGAMNRFYDPKSHHRSVDALIETSSTPLAKKVDSFDPCRFVSWLVSQSQPELENLMRQHTLDTFQEAKRKRFVKY